MDMLLEDPAKAKELGEGAKATALEKFNIKRFKEDWLQTFTTVNEQKKRISKQVMA
jgi:hypothetical protein